VRRRCSDNHVNCISLERMGEPMIERSAIQISETPTGKTLHLGPPSQPSAFCLSTCAWHSLTPLDAPANMAENKSVEGSFPLHLACNYVLSTTRTPTLSSSFPQEQKGMLSLEKNAGNTRTLAAVGEGIITMHPVAEL